MLLCQLAPPGDTSGEDLPPCELPTFDAKDRGAIMPVPKGIRPTLSKHRIEVRTRYKQSLLSDSVSVSASVRVFVRRQNSCR